MATCGTAATTCFLASGGRRPTLEGGGQVGAGVPELYVFVGPPGDAGVAQLDGDAGAVGVLVEQLQRVWEEPAAHLMRQPGGERSCDQGVGRDLTVEHAVGDGAARRDGLVVVVVVGGALLTGSLQGGQRDTERSAEDGRGHLQVRGQPRYREGGGVSVQLAVVTRLDVATVVLVEVGEAVVHEDAALRVRTSRTTGQSRYSTVKTTSAGSERRSHLVGVVQVEGDGAAAGARAVPAEVLRAVEAGTGHVHTRVVDLGVGGATTTT